jgi:hypothetical protein
MPYLLPDQFHFKHQFSLFLHDILVNIIKVGEYNQHFSHKVQLRNEKDIEALESINQEDTFDTFVRMGYSDDMDWVLIKQVYVAVLADFVQFVSTALETSTKGQLSVTYSLLRKPFKDNLFILEWILSNPDSYLEKFKSKDSYQEISIDKIKPEEKLKIIESANKKSAIPFLPSDFIYEQRYDKSKPYGFERSWQMANHLVTSYKHHKTEDMNLNFVFSNQEAKLSQWENLYLLLPSLLLYAVNICWSVYLTIQPQSKLIDGHMLSKIAVGYILCTKGTVQEFDNRIIKDVPLLCEKCGREIPVTNKVEKTIINNGYYRCSKCHRNNFFKIAHQEIRI